MNSEPKPVESLDATPRTDDNTYGGKGIFGAGFVSADFARQLERENNALVKEVERLKEANGVLQSQVDNADINWNQQKLISNQLRTQLAEATKDKERLNTALSDSSSSLVRIQVWNSDDEWETVYERTAIDTAMKGETK